MKILASDFDETIFYLDKKEQTIKNIEAIRKFVDLGNIFCIITGRNYSDLKILIDKYKIPYTYLICEDGAKIFNNVDYCLDTVLLKKEDIEKIIYILNENNCDYYLDDGYNKTFNYNDCVKIVINCTNDKEKEVIINKIKGKINVNIYASRFHINIINKIVNKEKALKKLFNLENLDLSLLKVIGDNANDYEMLKTFDGGIIRNHHPKLDNLHKKEYETLKEYIEELMLN